MWTQAFPYRAAMHTTRTGTPARFGSDGVKSHIGRQSMRPILCAGQAAGQGGMHAAENNDLLSLPLSSKGGEGNGAAASEHEAAFTVQRGRARPCETAKIRCAQMQVTLLLISPAALPKIRGLPAEEGV